MAAMNKQVIKQLMTTPFIVYEKSKPDSMGDCTDLPEVTYKGYVQETMQEVINNEGREELSNLQIYIPGDIGINISPTAEITCLDHIKQRIIKRAIYYGKSSKPDVAVLYLP